MPDDLQAQLTAMTAERDRWKQNSADVLAGFNRWFRVYSDTREELDEAREALSRLRAIDCGQLPAYVTRTWIAGWEAGRETAAQGLEEQAEKFEMSAEQVEPALKAEHKMAAVCCWTFAEVTRSMPLAAGVSASPVTKAATKPDYNFAAMPQDWRPVL